MGGKVHQFVVTLKRDARDMPWGLRLVGGSDIATPLIITRVNPGTPAQRELMRGDIITKIDDYDARDLRHEDAQNLFRNAGNNIRLAIQRDASLNKQSMSNGSSRCSSAMLNSPCPQPYIPPGSSYCGSPIPSGPSPGFRSSMSTPTPNLPKTTFPPDFSTLTSYQLSTPASTLGRKSPGLFSPLGYLEESTDEGESITNQYAHKQFNSPIGLYSEANIVDTIKRDTNTVPTNGYLGRPQKCKSYKKTVLYNPAKSETYKALQEDSLGDIIQEVPVPVQPKVFHAPTSRTGPIKKPMPQQQPQKNVTYVSSLTDENIQQSNSFKRLMYHVLADN